MRVGSFRAFQVMCVIVTLLCGTQTHAPAQTTGKPVEFEVASIRPRAEPDFHRAPIQVEPTRASYNNMTVQSLFTYAYGVGYFQISGPKWVGKDLFDVVAKFPEGASPESDRIMLQALLRDRFQLRFHVEKQEVQGYALVVSKDGPKLHHSTAEASDDGTPLRPGEQVVGQGRDRHRELAAFDNDANVIHTESSKLSMNDLARVLTSILRQDGGKDTVVDRTGLEGDYQISLDCPMPLAGRSDNPDAAPAGRSVLTNSLAKLGLRLVKQNSSVDSFVIDHVEKPSEN